MEQFNWNHLKYFYHVAREGSITKAAERLYVTPQTISSQLALLEDSLGYSLFDRHGKRLKLNQEGQLVLRYAEDIFKTGRELLAELKNAELSTRRVVSIGILDSIPKILSCQILDRVYSTSENIRIVTHETDFVPSRWACTSRSIKRNSWRLRVKGACSSLSMVKLKKLS